MKKGPMKLTGKKSMAKMAKKSPAKKDEGLKALAAKNPNLEYKETVSKLKKSAMTMKKSAMTLKKESAMKLKKSAAMMKKSMATLKKAAALKLKYKK